MISNPMYGWCDFKLGTFEGTPSYLTDVPVDLLDAFLDYHYKGMGMAWFDEEGTVFTFVITPYSLFIIEEKDKPILHDFSEMKIEDLEKELISDIESNSEDWRNWVEFILFDDYEKKLQHENEIKQRISKLKEYMNK